MTRRRLYLRVGLYAEGKSDYHFLLPLLNRLLPPLAASRFPGACEVADSLGIDAPQPAPEERAERIAAAIADRWEECTLFVIHADGAGDPESARRSCIDPGIEAARRTYPNVVTVPCVPVHETEAWMLVDVDVFRTVLGSGAQPALPAEPERENKPKLTLQRLLKAGGMRLNPERLYSSFGEGVSLAALRTLPAFQIFETELVEAIRAVARAQGWPG
ncbi:hypothetical protein BE04_18405 [Sorangium cellulosum]|uniref:DUF4276 domain-containing protein n=2 Tax=Sorangium cellulosum TaxID=56 RepID=A0A150PFI8_SORCE|nr:DUF4276 family protein [Sorangium cellulosum]AGP34058.1 hypothetical protein SCE1572_05820 [Sorangium cellulosum So0157-2]KYF54456.1 hypothetical protein BE04_18405 [Sorangium cellulosum]